MSRLFSLFLVWTVVFLLCKLFVYFNTLFTVRTEFYYNFWGVAMYVIPTLISILAMNGLNERD